MSYSLYLGPGAAGQIEIFSANCRRLMDSGSPLDKVVETSYRLIERLSIESSIEGRVCPFQGYADSKEACKEIFARFHPFELYKEYARQIVPKLSFPLIAVEGLAETFQHFSESVRRIGLEDFIIPKQMKLGGGHERTDGAWYNIGAGIPDISGLIKERGYPQIISGAHFLSISQFWSLKNFNAMTVYRRIPHDMITSLFGGNTLLLFLEEGDLIFDEGIAYGNALHANSDRNRNGLKEFEQFAAHFFHLSDKENRNFKAEIFPKEYLAKYDRAKIDYGQVLVSVGVSI